MGAQVLLNREESSISSINGSVTTEGWDAYTVWRERVQHTDPSATSVIAIASKGWDPYTVWKDRVLRERGS